MNKRRGMYQDGIHVKNNFSMSSGTLSVQPETMHWRQRRWYESVEDLCFWMQKTI